MSHKWSFFLGTGFLHPWDGSELFYSGFGRQIGAFHGNAMCFIYSTHLHDTFFAS